MPESHDVEIARERIRRIFQYLQELHRVRTPPVVRQCDRDWLLRLDALPPSDHVRRGYQFDPEHHLVSGGDAGFVLKVGRPRESECPEPSVVIQNWLKPGFDRVDADPEEIVRKTLKTAGGRRQEFSDSEERTDALEEWLSRKRDWETDERKVVEALTVFSDLFDLRAKFEREAEKYQLFLADGILVIDHPGGAVRHPILLQRVDLIFNASIPEFTIVDSDDSPELYTPLLRHVGVEGRDIEWASESLTQEHVHPLDAEPTSAFLRQLVQRFWPNGEFFECEQEAAGATGPHVIRQPHLYLGNRNHGLIENIDRYLAALPELSELPEALLRVVGIETGRGSQDPEDEDPIDILLTKPANPEQEQVIRNLEKTGAVLVQGPPGTGKSHTIANLIGHLLAQNKSILVTSHASKALRVVREHLSKPLQPLCVSVLRTDEESSRKLEESITGIVNNLASTSQKKLEREIETLAAQRQTLKQEYDELRDTLREAVSAEYEEAEVLGETLSPSEAARWVADEGSAHDWLPAPLTEGAELPLSREEVEELYTLNTTLDAEDEDLLASELPDLEAFSSPSDFATLYDSVARLEKLRLDEGQEFWLHDEQNPEELPDLLPMLRDAVELVRDDREWIGECIEAGREGGERHGTWIELVELIERCAREIPEMEPLVLEHAAEVDAEHPTAAGIRTCQTILDHLESGKTLGTLSTFLKPDWGEFIHASKIGDEDPKTLEHFQALMHQLQIRSMREELVERWDRQLTPLGAPEAQELGARPERKAKAMGEELARALEWHDVTWARCQTAIGELGLDWDRLLRKLTDHKLAHSELQRCRELVEDHLEPLVEARQHWLEHRNLCARRTGWLTSLDDYSRKDAIYPLIQRMRTAVKKGNYDLYTESRARIAELHDSKEGYLRRLALLERLEAAAPSWSQALRDRQDPHQQGRVPGDLIQAWRYRHWQQCLEKRAGLDLDQLQDQLNGVEEALLETTARYVEKRSWLAQLARTGLEQQQALTGWLGLHKKIGKGSGKQVARLKAEAKKTLTQCRSAVPVWIMPMSRVVECFDLATTRFDVVILDEASQSDVLGLVAFALARQVVVVGDHEQVSPYAVGQSGDRVMALIDELLTDVPNKQLYDGKTSVYDLARQSFGGTIRLLEHFRCVPDIIQFSNQLCYNGEVRALREGSSSRLTPHVVAHHVKDGQESNGINRNEALEIVSLVSAICKLEEYENRTIGVICMVGTDQALYIDSVLRKRLSVAEYQKRQILCGNASQFQGDERDVIFLSIVSSPSDRPLFLRQRDDTRKVFNVAASRARDQLWVVHSLNPGRDLKAGDLRLRLISHAENPAELRPKPSKQKRRFRSDLEKQVFESLDRGGYQILRHHVVGEYVIDLVIEGENGVRAALQCDGDRSESAESLAEEMVRQVTLRRLGWEFIRIRGSAYFLDPARELKKLTRRLEELEIRPHTLEPQAETPATETLHARVIKRAELIRSRWKDIPTIATCSVDSEDDSPDETAEEDSPGESPEDAPPSETPED